MEVCLFGSILSVDSDLKDEDLSTFALLYSPLMIFVSYFYIVQMHSVLAINPFTMVFPFLSYFWLILDCLDFNFFFNRRVLECYFFCSSFMFENVWLLPLYLNYILAGFYVLGSHFLFLRTW